MTDYNAVILEQLNNAVSQINEIDSRTGDEGSGARAQLNEMVRQNPDAVSKARNIIAQVNELSGEEKLLVARVLTTEGNKEWKTLVDKWVEDNKTTSTVEKPSDEELRQLSEDRARLVNLAKALKTALEASGASPESIPSIPSARKGSRGKRGPMVRGYNFYLDGSDRVTFTTFGNVITAAKSNQKAAREAMASQGLDIADLPSTWSFNLNDHKIEAFPKAQDEPDLDEDEEEDEEEDTDED